MTTTSPRKLRSRNVRIALLGAAAFSVAGCVPEDVATQVFPTLGECRAAALDLTGAFSVDDCEQAFALAEVAHTETAPRYDELALCEELHGGECTVDPAAASSGGGSVFMPLMMGYMMGSMMNNGRATMAAQPLYRTASGTYSTPSGATNLNANRGSVSLAPTNFRAAAPASAAQPMTRANVRASGGFGAGRTGGGTSGFGG
jgi:uncharacterized protein YgiB involved in biofilm formation